MNHDDRLASDSQAQPVLPLYLVTDRSRSMRPLSDGYSNFDWVFPNYYVGRPEIATMVRLTTVDFAAEYRIGTDFEDMTAEWPDRYPFAMWDDTKSYREGLRGLIDGLNWGERKAQLDSISVLEPLAFFVTCEGPVFDSMADMVLPDYDLGEGTVYKRPATDTWPNLLGRFRARQSWRPRVACFFYDDPASADNGPARSMMQDLAGPHLYTYTDADEYFEGLLSSLTSSIETSLAHGPTVIVPPPGTGHP